MGKFLQRSVNGQLLDQIADQRERETTLREHNTEVKRVATDTQHYLQISINNLNKDKQQLKKQKEVLQEELNFYKNLLSKPFNEIAEKNHNFAETYLKQQEILAEWMVSQKAFKELAIEFGIEKGQSAEVTIQQGSSKKIDVLEDKHNPEHNTNVGDSTIIGPHREKLINKFK